MKFTTGDLAARPGVRASLLASLLASPFRSPRRWRHAIVIQTPERRAVMHRGAFAAELRADGLDAAAHEVTARHVGAGEVLAYVLVDDEQAAGAVFLVVSLK